MRDLTAPAENYLPPIVSGRHASGTSPNDMGKIRASADTALKARLPRDTGLVSEVLNVCADTHAHTHTHTHAERNVRPYFLINN